MFNSPILDTAIGLVFVYLLYSLLATSINEAITTIFSLRANMLRRAIIVNMLSNTPNDNRLQSLLKGGSNLFKGIFHFIIGKSDKKDEDKKKLGDKFYDHPLIRNYGSNRFFPIPSYLTANNFSTILTNTLLDDFTDKLPLIAKSKLDKNPSKNIDEYITDLLSLNNVGKLKELLDYYGNPKVQLNFTFVDKETAIILKQFIEEGIYNIEDFNKKLEGWFDDTMNRVSGWYKRQIQFMLFIIGLVIAFSLNVDTLEITSKLSTDKAARDKIVEMAINATGKYKEDPNVKKIILNGVQVLDTSNAGIHKNDSIYKQYQKQVDNAKNILNGDIQNANNVLSIGWDFPLDTIKIQRDSIQFHSQKTLDSVKAQGDSILLLKKSRSQKALDSVQTQGDSIQLIEKSHFQKAKHVLKASTNGRKFLGLLITAFAICLGAPFWFDLLNKLVKLRASGKKEETATDTNSETSGASAQTQTININTQSNSEEAVG